MDLKNFSWVKDVVLITGGYGKITVVAVRGIESKSLKLKHSAKTGVFTCDEFNLVEMSHEALMDKIYQEMLVEKARQEFIKQNPNIGAFAW
jgi:hypothetical protein